MGLGILLMIFPVLQESLDSWFVNFWRFAFISCCASENSIHLVGLLLEVDSFALALRFGAVIVENGMCHS